MHAAYLACDDDCVNLRLQVIVVCFFALFEARRHQLVERFAHTLDAVGVECQLTVSLECRDGQAPEARDIRHV